MRTSRITEARNAFDTQNRQAEDMDMGELTREELVARLESVETRMEARARATDSKIDTLEIRMDARASVTDAKIDALESRMDTRFAKFEARLQKSFADFIKWMVASAIAMIAVGVTLLIFMFSNFTPRQQVPIVITVPAASAPATLR
jgi:hypothetical protein